MADQTRAQAGGTRNTKLPSVTKKDFQELKSLAAPPQAVIDVLTGTLLLLGHPKSQLAWRYVQKVLGQMGDNSLQNAMERLDASKVSREVAREARDVIKDLTEAQVRAKSAACAGICAWAITVMETAESNAGNDVGEGQPQTT